MHNSNFYSGGLQETAYVYVTHTINKNGKHIPKSNFKYIYFSNALFVPLNASLVFMFIYCRYKSRGAFQTFPVCI
jgi:hypothetical protein